MRLDKSMKAALEAGEMMAAETLKTRNKALKTRKKVLAALKKPSVAARGVRAAVAPRLLAAVGGPANAGVLVAEGDSWFDYPFNDVLSLLEDDYGYRVEEVAHRGDRVEDMAYSGGQLAHFTRKIERVIQDGALPKAILLSGGGNDVAGDTFEFLLNHARSPKRGLNEQMVKEIVDKRIMHAYITILCAVTNVCENRLGRKIRILVHGYDYAVADGRGFMGGKWILPGPWLEPGFRAKGYEEVKKYQDLKERIAIVTILIKRLNTMLKKVCRLSAFQHVKHVNLQGLLPNDRNYKTWWANELHPTRKGFDLVTRKIATAIQAPGQP